MSDTPRTDAALSTPKVVLTDGRYCYTEPWSGAVSDDFARTLEREIAKLQNLVRVLLHQPVYAERPDGTARPTTVYGELPYGWIHMAKQLGVDTSGFAERPEPPLRRSGQ